APPAPGPPAADAGPPHAGGIAAVPTASASPWAAATTWWCQAARSLREGPSRAHQSPTRQRCRLCVGEALHPLAVATWLAGLASVIRPALRLAHRAYLHCSLIQRLLARVCSVSHDRL